MLHLPSRLYDLVPSKNECSSITFYETLSFKHFIETHSVYQYFIPSQYNMFSTYAMHICRTLSICLHKMFCICKKKNNFRISLTKEWIYDSESKSQKKNYPHNMCARTVLLSTFIEVICYTSRIGTFLTIETFENANWILDNWGNALPIGEYFSLQISCQIHIGTYSSKKISIFTQDTSFWVTEF